MYLLDTNIVIDALKSRRGRLDFLHRLSNSQPLAFCSTVVAELFAGFGTVAEAQRARSVLLDSFVFVGTSQAAAELAGSFLHRYKKMGISLSLADSLIASTAIVEGHVLITDNIKHFPMPELNVVTAPADIQ